MGNWVWGESRNAPGSCLIENNFNLHARISAMSNTFTNVNDMALHFQYVANFVKWFLKRFMNEKKEVREQHQDYNYTDY